jgi:hypothetical protein
LNEKGAIRKHIVEVENKAGLTEKDLNGFKVSNFLLIQIGRRNQIIKVNLI